MTTALEAFGIATVSYFVVLNIIYIAFTAIAWRGLTRYLRKRSYASDDEAFASPLTPPISILLPAFNEEAGVVESVRSLLSLRYPQIEIVVINDGSKDGTLERLIEAFELTEVRLAMRAGIETRPLRAIYASGRHRELLVLDKENGGKADALNAGVNAAHYPYICAVDADAVLEQDALIRVAKPILNEPELIAATGGIVRIANGCKIDHGRVVSVLLPKSRLATFQVVEYFRAFLVGRVGWSRVNALLIISGAFGLFRRSVVDAVGGYSTTTVGEDMELVVRIHRYLRERGESYRIVFVPDPVCWTEAPESVRALARQRNRWQRGLGQVLWRHKDIAFNPRLGWLGLGGIPYFILFEFFGPVIEVAGYVVLPIAVILGYLSITYLIAFAIVAVLLGVLLSVSALALEEFSFQRHRHGREVARMIWYAALENFGYRQLISACRAWALVGLARRRHTWGAQQRKGIGYVSPEPPPTAAPRRGSPGA
jgi:cellulose synthase/poly-beta-1,6-N-acetylglucosamine synthase-like glycosyltransferase